MKMAIFIGMIAAGLSGCANQTGGANSESSGPTKIEINPLATLQRLLRPAQQQYRSQQSVVHRLHYESDLTRLLMLIKTLPVIAPDGRAIGFAVSENDISTTRNSAEFPPLPSGIKDGINIPLPASEIANSAESMLFLARQIGTYLSAMPSRPAVILSAPEPIGSLMQREIAVFSRNTVTVKLNPLANAKKSFVTIYLRPSLT